MNPISRAAAISLIAVSAASACRPSADANSSSLSGDSSVSEADYFCPMHPSYRSRKPGNCPICSMALVRRSDRPAPEVASGVEGRAAVEIAADAREKIGLRTSLVERRAFAEEIRAAGRVEVDEGGLSAVSPRYGGWIEELRVRSTGESVRAGDVLLSVYSPELVEAQRSYLAIRKALPGSDETVKSARGRLLLAGLTEEQIVDLEARGEPARTTELHARSGGVVTRREAVLGMRFESGATLYELADLSKVWVTAEVYGAELALVRVGTPAVIEVESANEKKIQGRVEFVYPSIAEATRTGRVRIAVPNPDGALLPGSLATVTLAVDLGEQVVVDVDAVLDTGIRKLVYVESPAGIFAPREITIGARSGGRAVVLAGLAAGENVVSRAAFLVDSESRLRSASRGSAGAETAPPAHAGH